MSLTGKGALSLRKKDVQQQKSIAVGFKKTQFAHKAAAGATGLDLTSLTLPTEMSSLGFTNPNGADLLAANIFFYRKNITIVSSLRGELIQDLSYTIRSSSFVRFEGFTAEEDEIFVGIIDLNPSTTLNVVDAQPLVVTGTLAANTTDINTGKAFEAGKFPTEQMGAVALYIDGVIQARNSGNQASPQDGNYYEVPAGTTSSLLRMNQSDTSDRAYMVISNGLLVEKPSQSQLQEVEKVQGQIDAMVPTLAQVAGVPETDFQAAPNNQDLKQFGDRVLENEKDIESLSESGSPGTPLLATTAIAGALKKNKTQVKTLAANITATDTDISDLRFNNLVVGTWYTVDYQIRSLSSDDSIIGHIVHDGIIRGSYYNKVSTLGSQDRVCGHITATFQATTTTVTFQFVDSDGGGTLEGAGNLNQTWARVQERNDLEITTDWT